MMNQYLTSVARRYGQVLAALRRVAARGHGCNLLFAMLLLAGCGQTAPPPGPGQHVISFSGYRWQPRSSEELQGPGRNYFSSRPEDVYVDSLDQLHLSIVQRNNRWYATEVISQKTFGYGTYIFYVEADLDAVDLNCAVGLYTWDDSAFGDQANAEVDIEFARWGNTANSNPIQYTVQPSNGNIIPERYYRPAYALATGRRRTTHAFRWQRGKVSFESYEGAIYPGTIPLARWAFDSTSPPRRKYGPDSSSRPIVVPVPTPNLRVRLNFWTLGDESGYQGGPASRQPQEFVVSGFQYIPE